VTPSRDDVWVYLSARGLTRSACAGGAAAWLLPLLVARFGVPLRGDARDLPAELDTMSVLAFVIPITAGLRLLDEGPPSLLRTRSRTFRTLRIGIVLAIFAQCAASAALIAWFAQLPGAHLIAVVLAQNALGIIGSATLGSGRFWVLPGSLTLLATTPGLLPWEINASYNQKLTAQMSVLAAVLIGFAAAAYLTWGLERARLSI